MFDIKLGHYLTYHHVAQSFFRRHREKFDGLIIPLSVATMFQQGTGGFVLTLKQQYAIDPRTPLFQADFDRSRLRLAHEAMAAVHGKVVQTIFQQRPLVPEDYDAAATQDCVRSVLAFQKDFAQGSAGKVKKYAALLGEDVESEYSGPEFLIPPYFKSKSRTDPWYRVSLALARAAADEKEDYHLSPVIHITEGFPENQFKTIAEDYSEASFDGLIIYVNDLHEYLAPRAVLAKYASLVQALEANEKPLLGLFGGYFTLMLRKVGMGCFSNGVGYGEYRDSGYAAGGQAVRRYYIPKLHRYFTDTEAQSILDIVNEKWIRCDCGTCGGRRKITNLTSQQLLDHFLSARLEELKHARDNRLDEVLDGLEETLASLGKQRTLPPDRYEHLGEWVAALRPFA